MLRNTKTSYGILTRLLHWTLFALISCQFLLAIAFSYWPSTIPTTIFLHESIGAIILGLGVIFIITSLIGTRPTLAALPGWQRALARLVHLIIYTAIIVQPIFAILYEFSNGRSVPIFNWARIPVVFPVDQAIGNILFSLHTSIIWYVLIGALILHVIGALYHAFIRRDEVFRRMWRGS